MSDTRALPQPPPQKKETNTKMENKVGFLGFSSSQRWVQHTRQLIIDRLTSAEAGWIEGLGSRQTVIPYNQDMCVRVSAYVLVSTHVYIYTVDGQILHRRWPGMLIARYIPTNNGFPWFQSGAGFCPSTEYAYKYTDRVHL